jgi:TolA-binding protein
MSHNGSKFLHVKFNVLILWVVLPLGLWGGHLFAQGKARDVIQEVTTHSEDGVSAVLIKLTGFSNYKMIPIEDREIMIALKDTDVSEDVFGSESIVGDTFVKGVEITQKPSSVACVVVKTHKPNDEIRYRMKESKKTLRMEISDEKNRFRQNAKAVGTKPGHLSKTSSELVRMDQQKREKALFVLNDGPATRDRELLKNALGRFEKEEWDDTIAILEKTIQSYPKSQHLELSHFLLAKSYHRRFENEMAEHLIDIVQHYQVAVTRFPESKYLPDAFLSMGDCYFRTNQFYEALTYYSLVLEKFENHGVTPDAMLQQGKVLALTKKPLMALRHFENLEKRYPESPFAMKARLETAKALFDLQSFKRSLKTLGDISRALPDEVYRNPDILLYTGYNYYELGQLREARETLSKALNYFPQLETKDLVLTRIADTFREDGMESKAIKLYDLVARTYPDSEGSVISLIRVAEEAEKAEVDSSDVPDEQMSVENKSKSAQKIYQQIIERFPDSPLAHVAMLKLGTVEKKAERYEEAIRILKDLLTKKPEGKLREQIETALQDAKLKFAGVQSKDGNHEKSVALLAEILTEYPNTNLRSEVKAALEQSLDVIFKKHKKGGNVEQLISYYDQFKGAVPFEDMPKILLQIGDAYRELHLYGPALTVFEKARPFYGKKDLPSNALMGFVECAYKLKEFGKAEKASRAFVGSHPSHDRVAEAHLFLGETLLMRQEHKKALQFLKVALAKRPDRATRLGVLSAIARASNALGDYANAGRSLETAIAVLNKEKESPSEELASAYRELGETNVRQGEKEKALRSFIKALELQPEGQNAYGLQFRLAQCYQWTKAWDKAEEMLTRIATSGDPFWSKVAQAQINEMNIQESMDTFNRGASKS